MLKKNISRLMLAMLLVGVFTFAFKIQQGESADPPQIEWTWRYGTSSWERAYSAIQIWRTVGVKLISRFGIAGVQMVYHPWVIDYDFYLVELGRDGYVVWSKTYGGRSSGSPWGEYIERNDIAHSVVQPWDWGYAVAGESNSFGAGDFDFYLVKTDEYGDMEWNKTYGGGDYDAAYSLVQTSDRGYAMAGYTNSTGAGDFDFYFVKTDENGNTQWSRTYGGTDIDRAYSVVQTLDGGYAIVGHTWSFGAGLMDIWLVKTDANGNMQWSRTYGGAERDGAYSLVQTSDGGYAIAGGTLSFGAGMTDFWLVKTDANGNPQWTKTCGGAGRDYAHSLVQTEDGGYALAGCTDSFGAGQFDFWLVGADPNGNMQWHQTYGGAKDDVAYSLVETRYDYGFAIAGETKSFGASLGDFWVIKTERPKIDTEIFFTLSPNPASPGKTVQLRGTLKDEYGNPLFYPPPFSEGYPVKIEYSTDGGISWNYIWTLKTNQAGEFYKTFTAPSAGEYLVRATYLGGGHLNPSNHIERLIVQTGGKVDTRLTLVFQPNPAKPGQTVLLSGTLKDVYGNPVYPAQVQVYYSLNGGASWNYIWTLTTNTAGEFSKTFTAPSTGKYLVGILYPGSTKYNRSTDTETLTVH